MSHVSVNPAYRILHRKGQHMASDISGTKQAIGLAEPDLVLLGMCATQEMQADAIDAFLAHALTQKTMPGIPRNAIQERLNQLVQSGLLQAEQGRSCAPVGQHLETRTVDEQPDIPDNLSISKNFAAACVSQGFSLYSPQLEQNLFLSVEQLLVMLAFGHGRGCDDVVAQYAYLNSATEVRAWLTTMVHAGFLVKPAVVEDVVGKPKLPRKREAPEGRGLRWQEIPADDRIPVYFVPHMENHYPLALGLIQSALLHHDDGALTKRFNFLPINYLDPNGIFNGPYQKFGPGIWLFSNYMWSMDINLQVSRAAKQHNAANFTIHGGPSTPDYPQASADFMRENPHVDVSIHNEGEVAIVELFAQLRKAEQGGIGFDAELLEAVKGITFRPAGNAQITRTAARVRMKDPNTIPSPYLQGLFDGYDGRVEAAIIESNRGCPFGCTFCDWGSATNQKVRKYDMDRAKAEIDWIGQNKVRVIWIADANFGLYDRDIELSEYIAECKKRYGYPQEVVVNYTKNSTWRLVEIIKIFTAGGIISQGIISIQTTDDKTLEVINRRNIKTEKYDELTKVFYDLKLPLSTDLMLGLPGITTEAFKADLQRYIDMDVSVKAYPTQLLPNSPMADPEYMEKYQIQTDDNDFLISTFSYTEDDLKFMKALFQVYTIADGYSLLRYVIRYMQWEHDIAAVDVLEALVQEVSRHPSRYPHITWAVRFFVNDKCMPGGWQAFYTEIRTFLCQRFEIAEDSGLDTILRVSEACMPNDMLTYPHTVRLPHDFIAYFSAKLHDREYADKPLTAYPAAGFTVSDPNNMVTVDMDYQQYDSHQYFWELQSDTARPKSPSEFVMDNQPQSASAG